MVSFDSEISAVLVPSVHVRVVVRPVTQFILLSAMVGAATVASRDIEVGEWGMRIPSLFVSDQMKLRFSVAPLKPEDVKVYAYAWTSMLKDDPDTTIDDRWAPLKPTSGKGKIVLASTYDAYTGRLVT